MAKRESGGEIFPHSYRSRGVVMRTRSVSKQSGPDSCTGVVISFNLLVYFICYFFFLERGGGGGWGVIDFFFF